MTFRRPLARINEERLSGFAAGSVLESSVFSETTRRMEIAKLVFVSFSIVAERERERENQNDR